MEEQGGYGRAKWLWERSLVLEEECGSGLVEEECGCGRGTWLLGKVVDMEEEGGCGGKKLLMRSKVVDEE